MPPYSRHFRYFGTLVASFSMTQEVPVDRAYCVKEEPALDGDTAVLPGGISAPAFFPLQLFPACSDIPAYRD